MNVKPYNNENKKTDIKIYVRPLPRSDEDYKNVKFLNDKKTIYVKCLQDHRLRCGQKDLFWKFDVDEVLYNYSQNQVFETVLNNCIHEAIEGNNTILIGYGQTGSGKSFTMNGLYYTYQHRGIAPRLITSLLSIKRELDDDLKIEYSISFCEMRDNQLFDLLNSNIPAYKSNFNKIRNISKLKFINEEEALNIVFEGEGNRLFDKKLLSRKCKMIYSHLCTGIITFHVKSIPLRKNAAIARIAKIHIIDLAGVDTLGNSSCSTRTFIDVGLSNQNLTFLEIFLLYLNTCKEDTVKIKKLKRISLLVNFLSDYLNGKSFIRFICHVRTNDEYLKITLSMLRMTEILKKIVPQKPKPCIENVTEMEYKILKHSVQELEEQLMHNAIFLDTDLDNYLCESRLEHIERTIDDFFENKLDNLQFICVTHTSTILDTLKEKFIKLKEEIYRNSRPNLQFPSKVTEEMIKETHQIVENVKVNTNLNIPATGSLIMQAGLGIGPKKFTYDEASLIQNSKTKSLLNYKQKRDSEISNQITSFDRENIWKEFTHTEEYKSANNVINEIKSKFDTLLENYRNEVSLLYKLRLNKQKEKATLMEAQMQRRLGKMDNYDQNGFIIPTENEIKCRNEIMKLQRDITRQEDITFVMQDDFKHLKKQLHEAKENLESLFVEYCKNIQKDHLVEIIRTTSFIEKNSDFSRDKRPKTENLIMLDNQNKNFTKFKHRMLKVMQNKDEYDFRTKRKWITDIYH